MSSFSLGVADVLQDAVVYRSHGIPVETLHCLRQFDDRFLLFFPQHRLQSGSEIVEIFVKNHGVMFFGKQLGISQAALDKRLSRAKAMLREALEDLDPDEDQAGRVHDERREEART